MPSAGSEATEAPSSVSTENLGHLPWQQIPKFVPGTTNVDAHFEELLARGVTIEQVRAYVLLRHSQLAPDDKKRVVVESQGDLKYNETVKAIRLLGSKFFGELQTKNSTSQGRMAERNRVHDVNFTEEDGQDET